MSNNIKFDKILAILLPVIMLYIAVDNGGYQRVPILGISIIAFILFIFFVVVRRKVAVFPPIASVPMAVFLLVSMIGVFWTKSLDDTIFTIIYLFCIFSFGIIAFNIDETQRMRLGYLSIAGATIIVIVGYVYYLMPILGLLERSHDMVNYFFATFYWKNPAAGYLSLFIPIVFFAFLFAEKKKILLLLLFYLFTTAFILTRSRGAWLAFALAAVIFIIMMFPKGDLRKRVLQNLKSKALLLVIAVIAIALTSYFLIPSDSSRHEVRISGEEMPQERSTMERLKMLDMGMRIVRDYPMGVGAGAFLMVYPRYLESSYYLSIHLHNQYLQYAVEMGILGGLSFLVFLFALAFLLYKNLDGNSDEFQVGTSIGACALFLHLFLDFDWTFAGITVPAFILIGMNLRRSKGLILAEKTLSKAVVALFFIVLAILAIANYFAHDLHDKASYDAANYEKHLLKASRLAPWNAVYRYNLANYYLRADRSSLALEHIERAYSLQPDLYQANYTLGQILYSRGDQKRGLELIKRSVELAPFSAPENQLRLSRLLLTRGDTMQAKDYLEAILANFSSDPDEQYSKTTYSFRYHIGRAHRELARIYRDQGAMEKAHETHAKAMALLRPRRNDNIARSMGFGEVLSPEWVAVEDFESRIEDTNLMRVTGVNEVQYDLWQARSIVRFYYIQRADTTQSFREHESRHELVFEDSTWKIIR